MKRFSVRIFLGFLAWAGSTAVAAASPDMQSLKPACRDGFCIEAIGEDLLGDGPVSANRKGRYDSAYVNLYHGADASSRIGRIYRHQFLEADGSGQRDYVVFDLPSPELERVFIYDGLYVQFINPESQDKDAKYSGKSLVKWKYNPIIVCESFEDNRVGEYKNRDIRRDFFVMSAEKGWLRSVASERAAIERSADRIEHDGGENNVLAAVNEKGKWGPFGSGANGARTGGGLTFNTVICASGDCDRNSPHKAFTSEKGFNELYMSYWIRFEGLDGGAFDFRRGGKLPGFAGGRLAVASGGGHKGVLPDGRNGWSARATFGIDGLAYQYLYYPDNRNPLVGDRKYGENRPWMLEGAPYRFPSNQWIRILQRIQMNSVDASGVGRSDGEIQVWVDNDMVLDERVRFRHGASQAPAPDEPPFHIDKLLDIDTIAMGLFHGGGSPGHAPLKDVRWVIDDFIVFEPLAWSKTAGCVG